MIRTNWYLNCTLKITFLFVTFSLIACAGGRHISKPSAPPSDMGISSSNKDLKVDLNYLIVPDGSGAWIKGARWDEYVITVNNISSQPIIVEKVRLIDPRGVYLEGGIDPWELEKQSEVLLESYKELAAMGAIQVAPSAMILVGGLGAAGAAVALAPVTAIAAPIYYFVNSYKRTKDRESIEDEFNRRQLKTFTISGSSSAIGSAFFPIVPSPRALVVDYRMTDDLRTIQVSLEKLAGLHLAPAPVAEEKKP